MPQAPLARATPAAKRSKTPPDPAPATDTRQLLKRSAQRLFADRGFDGVAVRDIVAASGQRNAASIHYYFGTKEALARELVVDGARRIDAVRIAALDALEAQTPQPTLRQTLDLLVRSSLVPPDEGEEATFLRFIAMLRTNHRALFLDAVGERWNLGFKRLVAHLKRLLPALPPEVLSQRLVFLTIYLGDVLATREAALAETRGKTSFWQQPLAHENLVDTLVGLLQVAPSAETLAALAAVSTATSRRNGPARLG